MKEDHQLREKSIPKGSACYTEKQGQYWLLFTITPRLIGSPQQRRTCSDSLEFLLHLYTEWLWKWKEKTLLHGHQGKRAAFAFFCRPINYLNCFETTDSTDHFPCETVLATRSFKTTHRGRLDSVVPGGKENGG